MLVVVEVIVVTSSLVVVEVIAVTSLLVVVEVVAVTSSHRDHGQLHRSWLL